MKKEMSSIKTSLPLDVENKEVQYYLHCVFIEGNKLSVMMLMMSSVKWDGNCLWRQFWMKNDWWCVKRNQI